MKKMLLMLTLLTVAAPMAFAMDDYEKKSQPAIKMVTCPKCQTRSLQPIYNNDAWTAKCPGRESGGPSVYVAWSTPHTFTIDTTNYGFKVY